MKLHVEADLAETIPDGTFGGARPLSRNRGTITRRWSAEEQEAHYQQLADAIGAPRERRSAA